MIFQKSEPVETGNCFLPLPQRTRKIREKAASMPNTCEFPWPVRADMKKRLPKRPVCGRTAPIYSVELSGCASSWLLPTVTRRKRAAASSIMATYGLLRLWVRSHSIISRELRQCATKNRYGSIT